MTLDAGSAAPIGEPENPKKGKSTVCCRCYVLGLNAGLLRSGGGIGWLAAGALESFSVLCLKKNQNAPRPSD